ncbi:MAG: hypothetical protein MJE68_02505 [Proteobacteria bacterium]|nr:hypothetical protein [Pseudomonadota bacterium]
MRVIKTILLAFTFTLVGCEAITDDQASSTRPPIAIPSTDPIGVLLPSTSNLPVSRP